jgi:hypothetical protein
MSVPTERIVQTCAEFKSLNRWLSSDCGRKIARNTSSAGRAGSLTAEFELPSELEATRTGRF